VFKTSLKVAFGVLSQKMCNTPHSAQFEFLLATVETSSKKLLSTVGIGPDGEDEDHGGRQELDPTSQASQSTLH
jgi:hypothetical protein